MSYYSKRVPKGSLIDINNLKGMSTSMFSGDRVSVGLAKIREDIKNLFSIRNREYFFNPEVGSNLDDYLFELNDFLLIDMVTRLVTTSIESHVNNVKVKTVEVTQEETSLTIYVSYDVITLGLSDKIVLYKDIQEVIDL